MVKYVLGVLLALSFATSAQAANWIPAYWYVREVPPNTIKGKEYPPVETPEGEAFPVRWFLDKGLSAFHLEPTSENANTERFPAGQPEFTCTEATGMAEIENPLHGAEGVMRFKHFSYSGCTQKGYCAAGETIALEQEMPVTSSGAYIEKGYAHTHDAFNYLVYCNGVQVSRVNGPPLNLFWGEGSAGTVHEGAEPHVPLTDTAINNARYWEPAAELGFVNELELGELTDSLSSKEMLIRGQLGYLGEAGTADYEDVYTLSS